MPVRRDKLTKQWFFRTTMKFIDGTRHRVFGTPGVAGDFHDLPQSKVGAGEAEARAIAWALSGALVWDPTMRRARLKTKETPPSTNTNDAAPARSKTIRDHAAAFLATYRPESRASEQRSKRRILDNCLLPVFGGHTIEELAQVDVDAYAKSELQRVSRKTVNNRLAVLGTLIRYVTGRRSTLKLFLDGMDSQVYAVPVGDVERLLAAATDPRYRVAILLAVQAGLRVGEIRGLQWGDIKDGVLTVRRALDAETNDVVAPKADKVRRVPLSPELEAELAKVQRRGLWVVSRLDGGDLGYSAFREALDGIYTRAGVARPRMLVHAMRHTFGTETSKEAPIAVVQELMGHEDVQTTRKYIDVSEDQKRAAISKTWGSRAGSGAAVTSAPTATEAPNSAPLLKK